MPDGLPTLGVRARLVAACSRLIFCQILRLMPVVRFSISLTVSSTRASVDSSAQRAAALEVNDSSSEQYSR